jgi:hypothetical protein
VQICGANRCRREITMMRQRRRASSKRPNAIALAAALAGCAVSAAAAAQSAPAASAPAVTYPDLVGLAESAGVVAEVAVKSQAAVSAERAPGLAPGRARLYLETQTQRVLKGPSALGEAVRYLADVPLGPKGKPPKLRKQAFIVFANPVAGRPGELQLVGPDAQLPLDPALEERVRAVIGQLAARDAAPRITGVRDVISVAGNLAGESETQMFVNTVGGAPVSLTVIRRPNMDPTWGVSWSEIVDQAAKPPEPGTIAWYRLACSLPRKLSESAFLQSDASGRRRAEADYQFILDQLGPCERTLR